MSITIGSHEWKVGANLDLISDHILWSLTIPGLAIFTRESFLGAFPFGQTVPVFFSFGIPRDQFGRPLPSRNPNQLFPNAAFRDAATTNYNHQVFEAFAQDRWQRKTLAVTYGVRYLLETVDGLGINADRNNLQPRVGLSYGFSEGRGVIRGGAGIFTAPHFWSRIVNQLTCVGGGANDISLLLPKRANLFSQQSSPCVTVNVMPGPPTAGQALAQFIHGQYPSGPLALNSFTHLTKEFRNPYSEQWSVQLEYEILHDLSVGIGHLGVHGLGIPNAGIQANAEPIGKLPNGKTLYQPKDIRFGIYQIAFPGTDSIYHGGFLTINKRFRRGFGLNANYTFSKTLDYPTGFTFRDLFQDPMNARLDWGLSNQHVPHRFVLTLTAEGPKRFRLTRGIKLGVITRIERGRYASIFTGFDANGDLEFGPDRVGNIGRNTYKGDVFKQVDFRISRTFVRKEKYRAEALIEFFNLFNRPNVTQVDTVYGAPDFIGSVPKKYGDGAPGAVPGFGQPAGTGPARQIQSAVRFVF